MTKRLAEIGASQRLRVEWLEATANLVLARSGGAALAEALDELVALTLAFTFVVNKVAEVENERSVSTEC